MRLYWVLATILLTVCASIGNIEYSSAQITLDDKMALYLDDPTTAFNVRIDLINKAKVGDQLEITYYNVKDDFYGLVFIDSLLAAAKRGAHIKFLVDDYENNVHSALWAMTELYPHFELRYFRPFPNLNPRTVGRRVHDKFIILNRNEIVFGSRNIGIEYFSPYTTWTDTDVYLKGSVAADASDYFKLIWENKVAKPARYGQYAYKTKKLYDAFKLCSTAKSPSHCLDSNREPIFTLFFKKCISRFSGYSKLDDCKKQYERVIKTHIHWWKSRETIAGTQKTFIQNNEIRQNQYHKMAVPYEEAVWLNNHSNVHDWKSGEDDGSLSDVLYTAIADAKESVWIAAPYMITTKAMRRAFEQADIKTNSKVDVIIATNSVTSSDSIIAILASMGRQKTLERNNVQIMRKADHNFMHSKVALIDENLVFVSSHNMDPRSEKLNSESGAAIQSKGLSHLAKAQLIKIFDSSWYDDPDRKNRKNRHKENFSFWDHAFHLLADRIILNIPGVEDQY